MPFLDHVVDHSSIRVKRSAVSGETPPSGSLRPGELAVNFADGTLFIGDADQIHEIAAATPIGELTPASSPKWDQTIAVDDDGSQASLTMRQVVDLSRPTSTTRPGMVRIVSTRIHANFEVRVKTNTRMVAVRWWDGAVEQFVGASPSSLITISKAIPTTGNYRGAAPKEVFIWPTPNEAGNLNFGGSLTHLEMTSAFPAHSLEVNGCSGLQYLDVGAVDGSQLRTIDLDGVTGLVTLLCSNSGIKYLDLSAQTALTTLDCSSNSLTSLDLSTQTSLTTLNCSGNSLTALNLSAQASLTTLNCSSNSLTALNLSAQTALTDLNCSGNSLTALNLSAQTALTDLNCSSNSLTTLTTNSASLSNLDCSSNSLTSLLTPGAVFGGVAPTTYSTYSAAGGIASGNQLEASALNQFYASLSPNAGVLDVSSNPGTADDNPSIATGKGYTVLGT
jgi:hypothetical protein